MDAAVRFQAQEQIPMPLDQAVLEHQVVGGVPAEEGAAPQVDVVVVAARRDMVSSFVEPIRRAGLEPVGVDLSAFAMIRALADAGVAGSRRSSPGSARARRSSTATSATSPTSPWRAAAPASSPASPTPASSRSPSASPRSRGLSPEHADPVALLRRPRAARRGARGRPGDRRRGARARSRRASPRCSTSCASRSTTTAPRRAPLPVERIVLCGPGSAIPGLAGADGGAASALPIAVSRPAGARAASTRPRRRA